MEQDRAVCGRKTQNKTLLELIISTQSLHEGLLQQNNSQAQNEHVLEQEPLNIHNQN